MSDLTVRPLVGEILTPFHCPRCGETHHVNLSGELASCCCGDSHQQEYCCKCGHFRPHSDNGCPTAPCGDYRCCIN